MNPAWREQLALLPDYLGNHLLLSISALLAGMLISLPLAVLVFPRPRLRSGVLAFASTVQTIPSLALLALMVPLLRTIGFLPALIALTLYSMLPILRNAVTGISNVDPDLVEAGRGMGMTDWQLLRRVQLPLALPVIVAGIRTAAVWVIGIATLSTPVGATSLGNYIFSGLQTQNYAAVVTGCVAAAALALIVDGLIRALQAALVARSRARAWGTVGVMVLLIGAGLLPLAWNASAERTVTVGAKTFTEQYVLAEALAGRLRDAGFVVTTRDSLGSTVVFNALVAGEVDCYVEYSGTIWANYMGRDDNPGRAAITREVRAWLADTHGIETVVPLGFENAYALAVRRDLAEARGLRRIADLAPLTSDLRLATDYEFFARPEWASLQLRYALDFGERRSMDSSLMYSALQAGEVDVITAYTTDGRIDAFDLVLLEDDREAFPPYDALLLIAPGERSAAIRQALAPFAGGIPPEAMRAANRRVDLDGMTAQASAAALRETLRDRD